MKTATLSPRRIRLAGAALVIVMVLVLAMAVMAGAFAYAMKVETKLAVNTQSSPELEWLGRSGIEVARWIIFRTPQVEGPYYALNQFWAGGPGPIESTDNPFQNIDLSNLQIGEGSVSIKIVDLERRIPINGLPRPMLESALQVIGAGAGDAASIAGAIMDWQDTDSTEQTSGGAESDYYAGMPSPYVAKNGPLDDVSELLMVRGVSPDLYYGDANGPKPQSSRNDRRRSVNTVVPDDTGAGMVDVFTALSSGQVNINTAPLPVLRVLAGGDEAWALRIKERREAGPGPEDDQPFRSTGEVPPPPPNPVTGLSPMTLISVQSFHFEIHVEARIGSARKRFVGVLKRGAGTQSQLMLFHPE